MSVVMVGAIGFLFRVLSTTSNIRKHEMRARCARMTAGNVSREDCAELTALEVLLFLGE